MIEDNYTPPGTMDVNGDLFPATPGAECIANLDGLHRHLKDGGTRIKHPALSHMVASYTRKLGRHQREIFNGKCQCGSVEKMEVPL